MNVVLCGMMGAGKSTVGIALARLSNKKLLDTDSEIVRRYGKISKIFEEKGEAYFRDLETELARALSEKQGLVISTGGGFVLREENVTLLKKSGKIIFLRATKETLLSRLRRDKNRPLLQGGNLEEKVEKLLLERTPIYERAADFIVDTDGKTKGNIAREILALVGETI